jgi:hypothetical protein
MKASPTRITAILAALLVAATCRIWAADDPGETKNRVGDAVCAEQREIMSKALKKWQHETGWVTNKQNTQ